MSSLVYYSPWSLMEQWHRDINLALNSGSDATRPALADSAPWVPDVDLHEEGDRFILRADLPGVVLKDIDITTDDGTLTLRGMRANKERKGGGFERLERIAGTFLRRFKLPELAQTEGIKASYTDGVLEIEIPKQPRLEAKRIPVTVN